MKKSFSHILPVPYFDKAVFHSVAPHRPDRCHRRTVRLPSHPISGLKKWSRPRFSHWEKGTTDKEPCIFRFEVDPECA